MTSPKPLVFGADPTCCDVVFQQPSVSSQHCQVWRADDGRSYIADMHSTNGTALNDVWLEPNRSYAVQVGDRVALGQGFVFQLLPEHLPQSSAAPSSPPMPAPPRVAHSQRHASVAAVTFGRSGEAADVLVGGDGVSGVHFEIRVSDTGYLLHDLGSTNGSFVHGSRVQAGHPVPVSLGDEIRLGSSTRVVLQAKHLAILGPVPNAAAIRGKTRLEAEVVAPPPPEVRTPHAAPSSPQAPVIIREERQPAVVVVKESKSSGGSSAGSVALLLLILGAMWFTNPTRQDFENHVIQDARNQGELNNQVSEALGRAWVRSFAKRARRQSFGVGCMITARDDKSRKHRWIGIFRSFIKVPA